MNRQPYFFLILPVSLLILLGGWTTTTQTAMAQSCVAQSSCPEPPIQFTPGDVITVEVVNRTPSLIALEQIRGTDAFTLQPSQTISFLKGTSATPNFSLFIWDVQGLSLQFRLSQPEKKRLRVEVYFGDGDEIDHHSLYLRNDGRIDIL